MPECPKCGTWNPEDKRVCWRCQTEMPAPKPEKKPMLILGMRPWVWIVLAVILLAWVAITCGGPSLLAPAGG